MASNFADNYITRVPKGKSFPSGVPFLMPGLGVVPKADPPQIDQVNQSCALAFQDSLSQVIKLCGDGKSKPKFIQLLFAQAFMVGTNLNCLCVIQWELEPVKKAPASAKTRAAIKAVKKAPPAKGKPKPKVKARR